MLNIPAGITPVRGGSETERKVGESEEGVGGMKNVLTERFPCSVEEKKVLLKVRHGDSGGEDSFLRCMRDSASSSWGCGLLVLMGPVERRAGFIAR